MQMGINVASSSVLLPEQFGRDYYFSVEKRDGRKKLFVRNIDLITASFNSLSLGIKERYIDDLAKAYFHCMKNISPKRVLELPISSSSSDAGTVLSQSPDECDEDCLIYYDLIAQLVNKNFQTIQIAFATWNIGGIPDFIRSLPLYNKDALPIEWRNEDLSNRQLIIENYSLWESRRIEEIKARIEGVAADIFCIQEICDEDISKLNDWFISKNLAIIADGTDAAVLFRIDRFGIIKSEINTKDRQSVKLILRLRESNQRISVGSVHIIGFDLENPETSCGGDQGRQYHAGDHELTLISQELVIDSDASSALLLGIDANSDEFVHPERIEIPLKVGFKRNAHHDGKTTSFNNWRLGEIQLDYLYWRKGCCAKIHFEPDPLPMHISPPSDHKMVSGKITILDRRKPES